MTPAEIIRLECIGSAMRLLAKPFHLMCGVIWFWWRLGRESRLLLGRSLSKEFENDQGKGKLADTRGSLPL